MSFRLITGIATLMVAGHAGLFATGAATLPVHNGRPVVATVNQDAISLDEFVAQLPAPVDRSRLQQGRGTSEEVDLLERLVTIKLLFHEAVAMGIADLPEVRKQVDVSSREILREVLLQRLVKDVKPDPAAVEKRFRELSKEWKTTSLLFHDEAAAKQAKAQLDRGANFTDVAAKAVATKTAKADADEAYHSKSDYLPQIIAAVAPLKTGQVSPVIRLQTGFVVVKVLDIRHPENTQARAAARQAVLDQQRLEALKAHDKAL
jgi:parvulin-like peptidyl-prolyl isomerase